MLEYDYYTGYPTKIISNLKRSITQYANNASCIKIGITNNPNKRWNRHKINNPNWTKMVVVYETSSINFTRKIEAELIEWTWDREESENYIGGGGGNFGEGYQYVYFLIQNKTKEQ